MPSAAPAASSAPVTAAPFALPGTARLLAALKPGQRYAQPRPPGSGDACALADLARRAGRLLVVLTADPLDAQRLADEIALFAPGLRVRQLPDWETLPYDGFSPHQDLISERLRTLYAAMQRELDVLTVPVTTALYRLAPPAFLAAYTFAFRKGERLDADALRAQLTLANYSHVTQVTAPGEFCVRGGLIDLFPMGSVLPYRLDLFDDEIESIRAFDVDTQRSLYPVGEIQLLPGREFPLDEAARARFRARFREVFEGDPAKSSAYRDVGNGLAFAGVEYYLPLFFDTTATLFDYLGCDAITVTLGEIDAAMQRFASDTASRYAFLSADAARPVLPPQALFLSAEDLYAGLKPYARLAWGDALTRPSGAPSPTSGRGDTQAPLSLSEGRRRGGLRGTASPPTERQSLCDWPGRGLGEREPQSTLDFSAAPDVAVARRDHDPLAKLRALRQRFLKDPTAPRIALVAESAGRRETLAQMLVEHGLAADAQYDSLADFVQGEAGFALVTARLHGGFGLTRDSGCLLLLSEADLYPGQASGTRRHREQARASDVEFMVRDLAELRAGDPVVHAQHGIGRYHGLVNLDLGAGEAEFLHLEYANAATLYVPVAQLHLIARYSGADAQAAPLHTLGSGQWERARRKAAKQAHDTAAELLDLYARRAARAGHAFKLPASDYDAFAAGFGFDETPDQSAAIAAVIADMTAGRPMDRLVCGDVGFGKTEVALRAAFLAVANDRQVALLCPTTLLAEQHAQTFADRFADWPVRIVELSRFRTAREIATAIAGINDGRVDIVIGTHKLLSGSLQFKRLGLVIIDEEHRFGVRQKERLKALRSEVDVLTLTATPIPRTLGMSLEGLRDFSVIATAPQKRLAIKTFVRREAASTIREALLRELKRGGQAYFLHNEVETIHNRRAQLQELVPEARVAVAHGQMPERELERVMKDFTQQRANVLLCTTIIETGIDVPSANTIVIHRADRFGLAQLHQLRGRVGRSHHQAYAYLLTPDSDAMTANAKKRLDAIQAMEELGAGFYLAMHDLEIRGTGEVLGDAQSGNIQEVGFTLYNDMLAEAVRALKAGEAPDFEAPFSPACEVNLHAPALLPADYCADVHARLSVYKRLASAHDHDALVQIQEELIDRFGTLPPAAQTLFATHRLRLAASRLGVQKIDASDHAATVQFQPNPPVEPLRIIELVQQNRHVKLAGPDRLRLDISQPDVLQRADAVRAVLRALQ